MNLKEMGVMDVFAQDEMTYMIDVTKGKGMADVTARWGEDLFWFTECV